MPGISAAVASRKTIGPPITLTKPCGETNDVPSRRASQGRLLWLDHARVALPAFVLQRELLERDVGRVGIEIAERNIVGRPAAIDLVGVHDLPGFIEQLYDDVLAEVRQRHLRPEAGAQFPNLVGPGFELGIVRHAALERNGVELGAAGRFVRGARAAALAMLDDLRRPAQRAHLGDARHVAAVPLHAEFELFVRVDPSRIDGELDHDALRAPQLERDGFSSNRHPALSYSWSMIFSENRYPLFGIML